jgi:hypothetical protein
LASAHPHRKRIWRKSHLVQLVSSFNIKKSRAIKDSHEVRVARYRDRLVNFAPSNLFSFSRGAKFGEFRPSAPAQVVCCSPVRAWGWGDIL